MEQLPWLNAVLTWGRWALGSMLHGMLQQHTWILPQGEEPLFFLWIHTSPEILPSETWAHFLAGSLQGLKRECFTILSVWSDNTWQVSQGRWMLFSVEAVAQEASSIGTGSLRVVPQLKYLENQSQCNVCSTYVTLSILRDFYSSQASNHNHEILHMQPIIQECARLILLTSRWWPCSMFIITGAAQAHCHASLSSAIWTQFALTMRSMGDSYPVWKVIFFSLFSKTHSLVSSSAVLKFSGGKKHHSSYFWVMT